MVRAATDVLPFTDQHLGGDRQFHLVWWQALGGISAEEHAHIFLYEPRGVIGSQDHTCVEAQRRIGKRFYDTVCIYKDAGIVANGVLALTGAVVSPESGTPLAHRIAQKPSKTAVVG